MSDDDREVRALLAAARRVAPPAHTKARLRARVLAGVTSGAAVSSATLAAKGAVVAAASGAGIASKAVIALVVGAGLGLGGSVVATRVASPTPSNRARSHSVVRAPMPERPSARPVATTAEVPPTLANPPTKADPPTKALRGAELKPTPAPLQMPSIDEETRLIAVAHRALASGRANDALGALERYSREFPNGALQEEASGTRVLALCAAGRRVEGQAARTAFLRAFPNSPLSAHVTSACAPP